MMKKQNYAKLNVVIPYLIVLLATGTSLWLKADIFNTEIQGKHTWRQSQTYLNIRNFTREDFNILNPRTSRYNIGNDDILRMEFPLMQWLIAAGQRVFGESILLIRISMALIYLLSCLGIFLTIKQLYDSDLLGAIAVLILSFFPVYLYQSINILPDNFALATSLIFLYFFFKGSQENGFLFIWLSALFFAISALCKLPFIIYGAIPLLYSFRHLKKRSGRHVLLSYGLLTIPIFLWYYLSIPNWKGNNINLGIFDSNIDWPLYFTFLKQQFSANIPLVVLGIPTILLLTINLFFSSRLERKTKHSILITFVLFLLYFLYILKQIREGHDYYFLPFLPIFTIWSVNVFKNTNAKNNWIITLAAALLLSLPISSWNKVKDFWDINYAYFNPDFFIYRDQLRGLGDYNALSLVGNDNSNSILLALLDKKGYVYMHDHFPIDWILDLKDNRGVKYLYSDSRAVDAQEGFDEIVEKVLLEVGSIRVFELKQKESLE